MAPAPGDTWIRMEIRSRMLITLLMHSLDAGAVHDQHFILVKTYFFVFH